MLWWKAVLIEWPRTQPPFLIITAVQSLLITIKVCRAPRSPVMLQAIQETPRGREEDPALLTKSTFKEKAKKAGKGGQRQSSVAALLIWFLSLYLVHDEVETLFTIKNAECTPFFLLQKFFFQNVNGCQKLFFFCCSSVVCCCQRDLFVDWQ